MQLNLKQLAAFDDELMAIGFDSGMQGEVSSRWIWNRGNLSLIFESSCGNCIWRVHLKGLQQQYAKCDFDTWQKALIDTHHRVQSMLAETHFPYITD